MRWLALTILVVGLCSCRSYRRPASEALTSSENLDPAAFIKDGKIDRDKVILLVRGGIFKDDKSNLIDMKKLAKFFNDLADVSLQI